MTVSGFGTATFAGVELAVPFEVEEIAPNGVFSGDPGLSSQETGAALVERLTEVGARVAIHVAALRTHGGLA